MCLLLLRSKIAVVKQMKEKWGNPEGDFFSHHSGTDGSLPIPVWFFLHEESLEDKNNYFSRRGAAERREAYQPSPRRKAQLSVCPPV